METATRVRFGGDQIENDRARTQVSELVWASLRKQQYAEGTECRVMVTRDGEGFYVQAAAKEPRGPVLRLLEFVVPSDGHPTEKFDSFLEKEGLAAFRGVPSGAVRFGGDEGAAAPDFFQVGAARRMQGVGRNELCPCGSGKKFKKCCGVK